MKDFTTKTTKRLGLGIGALMLTTALAQADQVILDDLIVDGSACIGQDCVNGESFGFDTLRLKENNLRIKFQDTSNTASFPSVDWQLTANESDNGGQNRFSIDQITNSRTPFTIRSGAPTHSLYVDDQGDIGIGTSTPVVEAHIVDGDTPTLRLEQNGSSGFTPQIFDIAANETNFFVRDVTNGSALSFKIRPGADANSLVIDNDNNIGVGILDATAPLHVRRTTDIAAADPHLFVENTNTSGAGRTMAWLENNGPVFLRLQNNNVGTDARWVMAHDGTGNFGINRDGADNEFLLAANGNLTITGSITTAGGTCGGGCDAVFGPDYEILPIAERADIMWENGYLPNVGPTIENEPFNVSDKVGRMLNELEHAHIYIAQLNDRIAVLEEALADQ